MMCGLDLFHSLAHSVFHRLGSGEEKTVTVVAEFLLNWLCMTICSHLLCQPVPDTGRPPNILVFRLRFRMSLRLTGFLGGIVLTSCGKQTCTFLQLLLGE